MNRGHLALLVLIGALAALFLVVDRSEQEEKSIEIADAGFPPPRGYVCYRARSSLTIDGRLDDAAWKDAPWSEPFRDIEGDKRPEPPLRTRVKMLWDDRVLYIAAELEEPNVWATLRKHDSVIFNDNDFEVFIDPDADNHLYGELEVNALATTWDLLLTKPYKDQGRAIDSWEISGLKVATHIDGTLNDPRDTDRGWSVEIYYPWKSMSELTQVSIPPRDGDQWRINFSRVEWDIDVVRGKVLKIPHRPEHNWVWSPQGAIDMHRPDRWGILQFSTARPGTASFRPDPAQPARDYLHRIYYAQAKRHKDVGRYADTLGRWAGGPRRLAATFEPSTRNHRARLRGQRRPAYAGWNPRALAHHP